MQPKNEKQTTKPETPGTRQQTNKPHRNQGTERTSHKRNFIQLRFAPRSKCGSKGETRPAVTCVGNTARSKHHGITKLIGGTKFRYKSGAKTATKQKPDHQSGQPGSFEPGAQVIFPSIAEKVLCSTTIMAKPQERINPSRPQQKKQTSTTKPGPFASLCNVELIGLGKLARMPPNLPRRRRINRSTGEEKKKKSGHHQDNCRLSASAMELPLQLSNAQTSDLQSRHAMRSHM